MGETYKYLKLVPHFLLSLSTIRILSLLKADFQSHPFTPVSLSTLAASELTVTQKFWCTCQVHATHLEHLLLKGRLMSLCKKRFSLKAQEVHTHVYILSKIMI